MHVRSLPSAVAALVITALISTSVFFESSFTIRRPLANILDSRFPIADLGFPAHSAFRATSRGRSVPSHFPTAVIRAIVETEMNREFSRLIWMRNWLIIVAKLLQSKARGSLKELT